MFYRRNCYQLLSSSIQSFHLCVPVASYSVSTLCGSKRPDRRLRRARVGVSGRRRTVLPRAEVVAKALRQSSARNTCSFAIRIHLPESCNRLRASERPATQDRTCGRRFNCRGLCLSSSSAQASGSKAVKPVVNCGEPFLLARSLARTQTQSDRSILSDRWAIWCSGQTSASAASGRLRAAHNAIHTIAKEPHSERARSLAFH